MAQREAFRNFQEKRMEIFRELVRYIWENKLTRENLDKIADKIVQKYSFETEDIPFVKDHIRVAMGLDPRQSAVFSNELAELQSKDRVESPILARIEGACQDCGEKFEDCTCYEAVNMKPRCTKGGQGP